MVLKTLLFKKLFTLFSIYLAYIYVLETLFHPVFKHCTSIVVDILSVINQYRTPTHPAIPSIVLRFHNGYIVQV